CCNPNPVDTSWCKTAFRLWSTTMPAPSPLRSHAQTSRSYLWVPDPQSPAWAYTPNVCSRCPRLHRYRGRGSPCPHSQSAHRSLSRPVTHSSARTTYRKADVLTRQIVWCCVYGNTSNLLRL